MTTEGIKVENGVDFQELLARVDYDRELLREVFELFSDEFPQLYVQLKEAAVRSDLKQVQVAAHTMKGMLASLSFWKAVASAKRIEAMAKDSVPEGIGEELALLESRVASASTQLTSICEETPG